MKKDEVESAATSTNAKPTAGTVSSRGGSSFAHLLAMVDAAPLFYKGINPDADSQRDPLPIPISTTSLRHNNDSLEQTPATAINTQEPQGLHMKMQDGVEYAETFADAKPTVSSSEGVSSVDPLALLADAASLDSKGTNNEDKRIRGESRQVVGMQINVEMEKNVPSTNGATPHNQELTLCTSCARKVVAAVTSIGSDMCGSCPKPAAGSVSSLEGSHGIDLKQSPTPKQRRMKYRPKVITEDMTKKTRKSVIPKPFQSKGKPIGKRKYVRKPCLRSLNLELSEQLGDGNDVLGDGTVHLGMGIDVVEKTHQPKVIAEGIAEKTRKPFIPKPVQSKRKPIGKTKNVRKSCLRSFDLELSKQSGDGNAVLGDGTVHLGMGIDVVEKTCVAPGTRLSSTNPQGTKLNAKSTENRQRKGLVNTLDGREKSETKSSQNNSSNNRTGNLTPGLYMGATKRKHSSTTDHADISHMNLIEVHYNGLHAYQRRWVQFPAVQKKRRSDSVRFCDYATTPDTTRSCNTLPDQFTRRGSNSKMHASFKKKRTTRENRKKLVISTFASAKQMHHGFLLNGYQPSWTMPLDSAHQKPWNYMQIVEALTEKFSHLDINIIATSSHELKALIPYKQQNQKDKVTQGDGAINPVRKDLPLPTSLFANEPQALMVEPKENKKWDGKRLSQLPVCCQSSLAKGIITEHSEGKQALTSNDSPGTTSLADELNCIPLKSNEGSTREQFNEQGRWHHHHPIKAGKAMLWGHFERVN